MNWQAVSFPPVNPARWPWGISTPLGKNGDENRDTAPISLTLAQATFRLKP